MRTIILNNGVKMPKIGLGTFKISDPAVCERSVLEAIDAGYRLIDTAQAYDNEKAVGRAVKQCGLPREELFITTKLWFRNFEKETARAAVLESMKKLQLDYIDLVLIHWPFGNYYAAYRELEKLYEEGILRAIGVSNFDPDRLIDLVEFNQVVPAVNQIETHLFCQRREHHAWMEKYGVCHQAYAPLGQGKANEMFEHVEVRKIAAAHGKTPAQILLRFLIESDVAIIPKSVHMERIQENMDIFDFELTKAERETLKTLDRNEILGGKAEDPERAAYAMTW